MSLHASLIAKATMEKPVRVSDLIGEFDLHDHAIPYREWVEGAIQQLLDDGVASHIGGNRLVPFSPTLPVIPYEGISEAEYDRAVDEYHADMVALRRRIDDDIARIATEDVVGIDVLRTAFPDATERKVAVAAVLAKRLDPAALSPASTFAALGFADREMFSLIHDLERALKAQVVEWRSLCSSDQTIRSFAARLREGGRP
jgi:hypothetical protein